MFFSQHKIRGLACPIFFILYNGITYFDAPSIDLESYNLEPMTIEDDVIDVA